MYKSQRSSIPVENGDVSSLKQQNGSSRSGGETLKANLLDAKSTLGAVILEMSD